MRSVDRTRLPLPGADPAFSLPAFERADLGDGTAVWVAEHHRAPLLTLHLLLPTGYAADPPDKPGLASLTAALFEEGAAGLSAVELDTALKRIGGHLTTAVTCDATVVALTVLSQHAAAGLRLLFETTMRPRLDADDVARERELRINRIRQQRQSPGAVADRVFLEALYGPHPYGHLSIGTESALRSIGPADVAAFHRRGYAAAPWTLVAAGDVAPTALIAEAERAWAAARPPVDRLPAAAGPPEPGPAGKRMVFVARDGAVQSEIRLGHAGPPRRTPDYYALLVLNMVMAGSSSAASTRTCARQRATRTARRRRSTGGWVAGRSACRPACRPRPRWMPSGRRCARWPTSAGRGLRPTRSSRWRRRR